MPKQKKKPKKEIMNERKMGKRLITEPKSKVPIQTGKGKTGTVSGTGEDRDLLFHPRPWSPFERMRQFEHEMDDFFRSFEDRFWVPHRRFRHLGGPAGMRGPAIRQPLLDIKDTGKNLEVRAEIPGIPKENIDIKITEDSLEISAKSDVETEEKGHDYFHRERSFHSFYRNIPLPTEVIQNRADARLENGILKITVPKKAPPEKDKPYNVKIK